MSTDDARRIPLGTEQELRRQLTASGVPADVQLHVVPKIARSLAGHSWAPREIVEAMVRAVRTSELAATRRVELMEHIPGWIRAVVPQDYQEHVLAEFRRGQTEVEQRSQQQLVRTDSAVFITLSWVMCVAGLVTALGYCVEVSRHHAHTATSWWWAAAAAVAVVLMGFSRSRCTKRMTPPFAVLSGGLGLLLLIAVVLAIIY